MKINYPIILILTFVIISCENVDTNKNPEDTKLVANAGIDQTTIVGSYGIFDPTGSTGNYDLYDWQQDEMNPEKVLLYSQVKDIVDKVNIQKIGFVREGKYQFRLVVRTNVTPDNMNGTDYSEPDTLLITVNSNPQSMFEDLNLEIAVRTMLEKQTDTLTDAMLLTLDSLRYSDGASKISSLNGLERCLNIKCLQMGHQNIADISPVAALTKLRVLDLTQNRKISDITPLAGLTELEWLDLDSNLITDISSLINLVNLRYLNLMYNEIKDISHISNATNLEKLWMADASINDLSALSNMINLELLWFSRCDIKNISCLQNLTNIKTLKLTWNHFTDISSLSNMKILEWVALEKNNISDISALRNLPNLEYVRLWDNQITNIKPLVDNAGIGKGDIVGLSGNPLDEISINEYIPALQARGVLVTW